MNMMAQCRMASVKMLRLLHVQLQCLTLYIGHTVSIIAQPEGLAGCDGSEGQSRDMHIWDEFAIVCYRIKKQTDLL